MGALAGNFGARCAFGVSSPFPEPIAFACPFNGKTTSDALLWPDNWLGTNHCYSMAITVTMDRAGRIVVPRQVRERFGLTGASHEMELIEEPDCIVLRPAGTEVPAARDASGCVVFHSDSDSVPRESIDPVALVEKERESRVRKLFGH